MTVGSSEETPPDDLESMIGGKGVGVLYAPGDYAVPKLGLRHLWRRHLVAHAAVRDRDYMEALFRRHFPHAPIIAADPQSLPGAIETADHVVLLFPDAIGADFSPIERAVAGCAPTKPVLVLNGRRRFFRLDVRMRR